MLHHDFELMLIFLSVILLWLGRKMSLSWMIHAEVEVKCLDVCSIHLDRERGKWSRWIGF